MVLALRGLLVCLGILACVEIANSQEIQSVPNAPAAKGDQVWVVRDGTIVGKFTGNQFADGAYINVNGTVVGTFCRPQAPQPQPQPFPVPPPFETPKVEPAPPMPPVVPEASGPDLLQVLTTVGGIIAGWYIGRKYADDDDEQDAPAKEPAVVA